jgi:hypothetical protein
VSVGRRVSFGQDFRNSRGKSYPNEPGVSPRSLWRARGPVNLGGGCAASYFGGDGIAEEW